MTNKRMNGKRNEKGKLIKIEIPDNEDSMDYPRWPMKYIVLYRSTYETRTYYLGAPLSFISAQEGVFSVRPGFKTDGASVPRLFWAYASPFAGAHTAAVILHDALYASHCQNDRGFCDKLFYEALLTLPMRSSKAWAMYQSVRLGGKRAWKEKSFREIQKARQLLDVRRIGK